MPLGLHRFLIGSALLALAVSGAWAQTDAPAEPVFRYYAPLPESTFRGDWQFRLELSSDLEPDDDRAQYSFSLLGYDPLGEMALQTEPVALPVHAVYRWQEIENFAQARLQSLAVVSDAPLTGVLWMWSEKLGLFNAVELIDKPAQRLALAHIPSDFFAWRSSFAVQGVPVDALYGDIIFGYFLDREAYTEDTVWEGLEPNGYLTGTPFHDIIIGDLGDAPALEWGMVRSASPDYLLAGYQTFLRLGDTLQSAAIELTESGAAEGRIGFSQRDPWYFQEWLAVTNPNNLQVQVAFTLTYLAPPASEEDVPHTATAEETVTLGRFDRQNFVLGLNLFAGLEGEPISLSYRAVAPSLLEGGEEVDPGMPVYVIHLQSDETAAGLGASLPQGLGSQSIAWLNRDDDFESLLEIYAPENRETVVAMTVYGPDGAKLFAKDLAFSPHQARLALDSQWLRDELYALANPEGEADPVVAPGDGSLRVALERKSGGLFFTKLSGFRTGDFAIVNPALRFVREIPDFKRR